LKGKFNINPSRPSFDKGRRDTPLFEKRLKLQRLAGQSWCVIPNTSPFIKGLSDALSGGEIKRDFEGGFHPSPQRGEGSPVGATPEGGDEGVDISPFDNERLRGIY